MNQTVVVQQQPTNGLGVGGFVTSLVSLVFTCGLLSPISLILCFIAIFKKPRGLAIAGLVISGIQVGCIGIPIAALAGFIQKGYVEVQKEKKEQTTDYLANKAEVLETLRSSEDPTEVRNLASRFLFVDDSELKRAITEAEERLGINISPTNWDTNTSDERELIPDQD